jgi:NAD(P) transhydrogenase subunit alpha
MHPAVLVLIFAAAALVGYKLIKNVPSLLHTPLMSGMNALSGITVLGALSATGAAVATGSRLLGYLAVFLAVLNVAGGFGVTHRMLKMFNKKDANKKEERGL